MNAQMKSHRWQSKSEGYDMLPRFEVACGDERREETGKGFRFSRQIFAFQVARSLRDPHCMIERKETMAHTSRTYTRESERRYHNCEFAAY
eukprot:scaffold16951_cov48-Attheya_sp.AAC.10